MSGHPTHGLLQAVAKAIIREIRRALRIARPDEAIGGVVRVGGAPIREQVAGRVPVVGDPAGIDQAIGFVVGVIQRANGCGQRRVVADRTAIRSVRYWCTIL
jgi:hypothetical protein